VAFLTESIEEFNYSDIAVVGEGTLADAHKVTLVLYDVYSLRLARI
jgi:hypothetical protein